MNIGFSKNSFWEDSIFTEEDKEPGTSASKIDAMLEKGWSTWKPAFVTDHAQPNEFKKMEVLGEPAQEKPQGSSDRHWHGRVCFGRKGDPTIWFSKPF